MTTQPQAQSNPQRQPFRGPQGRPTFNIRSLNMSELEELSNQIAARMDQLDLGYDDTDIPEEIEEPEVPEITDEDFPEREG